MWLKKAVNVCIHVLIVQLFIITIYLIDPVEVKLRECLFTATVLFSASLLDLAILLLHPSLPANTKHLFQLSLPEGIELLGSQVHAIGYHHKSVKVTSGILSKLVCDPDTSVPILIKSNASLHNGMSGGLLVHTETSIPIGMLQFNMKLVCYC